MRLFQQIKTIPLFINYFLSVVDQHSIQAPFAYQFYQQLKKSVAGAERIQEIENIRHQYLNDNRPIIGDDLGAGSRMIKTSTIASIARHGISSRRECMLLHKLASIFNSEICVELGTSLGIATSYIASAKSVKKVFSFEGNNMLVDKAYNLFQTLGNEKVEIVKGDIDVELPILLESLDNINFAIIDANHTKRALMNYYEMLSPKMNVNGIMVIDDIRWSLEMYNGWKKIIQNPAVSLSFEFLNQGLLFFKEGMQKQHYILSI